MLPWPGRCPAGRAALLLSLLAPGLSQAAVLEVSVRSLDGRPLAGATVAAGRVQGRTDAAGSCRLELPPGRHRIVARLDGFASAQERVRLAPGVAHAAVVLRLPPQVAFSESVTVSPTARDAFEAHQPVSVLADDELGRRLGATLAEAVAGEVGVAVRSFGPGPARPVIRGLDGERVLILQNGSRTGDLSSQSPDHAVPLDPALAARIEVVRGPATLLYGASALGGVVNVVSHAIPPRPLAGMEGIVRLQAGTANGEAGLAGTAAWGDGRWAVRAGASRHGTGDVRTPDGRVHGSGSDRTAVVLGFARTGERGFAGASYGYDDTSYGVPFSGTESTTLSPRRHHFDARAERRGMGGWLTGVSARLAYRDYAHDEVREGRVATRFESSLAEGQALLNHAPAGPFQGTLGLWGLHRDVSASGAGTLAPPTRQRSVAVFVYEEASFGRFTAQFGARAERTSFDPKAAGALDRRFTSLSASAGLLRRFGDAWSMAASLSRSARPPSVEELYNFGPHPGSFSFEIGRADLEPEVAWGADLSVRCRRPRLAGELTLFRNAVERFIFTFPAGEVEGALPVVNFLSSDALLYGFEARLDAGITQRLWVHVAADAVRGRIRTTDQHLPRIPPLRGAAGVRYRIGRFHAGADVRAAAEQDRVYGEESPTAGYALANLEGSYSFERGRTEHLFVLRLTNATDALYRSHLSFIKELAPEMGRSLRLVYSMRF